MIKIDVLEYLIQHGPGRTELELAKAIHGPDGYQQQVNQDINLLIGRGKIERREETPYRYYPAKGSLRVD
jgi:hypothetical protein